MGLDFDGADAHWSYSGFNRFREKLGAVIGIKLKEMNGFRQDQQKGISWDNVSDPIKPLLNHSDCDGEISHKDCGVVAKRLRELVSFWSNDDYDKQEAINLAVGMESCHKRKKPLLFT